MEKLISIKYTIFICFILSCSYKDKSYEVRIGNSKEEFNTTLDSLIYIVKKKDICGLTKYADSNAINQIIFLTDSLINLKNFPLVSGNRKSFSYEQFTDSSIMITIGEKNLILGAPAYQFKFNKKKTGIYFVIFLF